MCLGHTHALSGAVTGTAVGEFALHLPPLQTVALAGCTAAFATLPDLDQCGSTVARSLGFLSESFAWIVHKISGGHRHATHSILGVAGFTAIAWLCCAFRHTTPGHWSIALLLALAFAAGLRALRIGGHFADLAALGAAFAVGWEGWSLALIPVACGLGCLTHIAGDMLTVQGCPLAWPLSTRHFGLPRPVGFTTGTWRENVLMAPALLLTLGWLSWHAVIVR
jgi:membrane-bound metal-dependent hydrolase YbcI (DUF457 family)